MALVAVVGDKQQQYCKVHCKKCKCTGAVSTRFKEPTRQSFVRINNKPILLVGDFVQPACCGRVKIKSKPSPSIFKINGTQVALNKSPIGDNGHRQYPLAAISQNYVNSA